MGIRLATQSWVHAGNNMSQNAPPSYAPPPPSNGLGIAGFIVSLVGLFTGGILSPLGLLLSFIALFRRPRGFATAGFIIGLLGSLFLAAWLAFFGFLGFSCFNLTRPLVVTGTALSQAQQKVQQYSTAHMGTLPDDATGNSLITGLNDGWGHQVRYEIRGLGSYDIRSAGPDGVFNNEDDVTVP